MTVYSENNVYDEALKRIRMLYDYHDDVIVSMSGGKDSTVLFELTMQVARERGRLPLKVFWLDQEAEWQETVDYMDSVMRREDVKPYWFQIPFDFTNSLSPQNNFVRVWDESIPEKWVHPKSDISIKENPSSEHRFHELVASLPMYCVDEGTQNCAVLVGMRANESLNRRTAIMHGNARFRGETWCRSRDAKRKCQVFWPIYDFTTDDIWTAIAKNHWQYNRVYDFMYRWGVKKSAMRVSALIHETAWHSIEMLQEFERDTYNKFTERIPGVSTFNHSFDEGGIIPRKLPFAFKDWKEYRDYLLIHITKPEYWDLFRRRWANQNDDEWYKVHVQEIILNDIDGTNNANYASRRRKNENCGKNGVYHLRDLEQFNEWKGEEDGN